MEARVMERDEGTDVVELLRAEYAKAEACMVEAGKLCPGVGAESGEWWYHRGRMEAYAMALVTAQVMRESGVLS